MADDIQSNIRIDIDAQSALATLKNLQRQISAFHTSLIRGSADAAAASAQYQQKLINSINKTGQFSAEISRVSSSAEAFTTALEKNKLSLGEYFRYAGGASKTFGKMFSTEFKTIEKTAIERVKTLQTQYINLGRDASGALKTIKIRPLALDMENLSTKMQVAAQKTQILNKLMMQGSTNLLNFGKNTQWAGRQLMVGFTVPLTMLGSVASKTFMEMEEAVIKFKRVYGDATTSIGETDKMVSQLQSLASEFTKYGVAVSDTMNLAAEAAAMGKTGADLLSQVGQAAKLATLGNIEQSKALETTMSITNAFGVATEDLAKKINFLNAVENQTVTSIDDLTTAIPKAGPVIKQLGGDVEDLAFFLTAMKEGGINASEGANALKSGLASIINPTKQATEFMSKFGISITGIVEQNKGNVKGMVIGLAQALNQLDPLNRARAIEQMFGKFQFARISTLLQNVTKDGSQASRVLQLTRNTAAELAVLSQRELNKMEASPMYKFQKAVEDLKKSLVPLGEAFVKAITPIVNFAKGILDRFNALDEGGKTLVTNLVGIIGVVGPAFLMGFGLIANGVANVIKLFTGLKMAFNRATGTTQELGVQTDYMTQMELEAAAAASSLDQAHSNLTQTFSVEREALEALTAAYQKAVVAQEVFQGNSPQLFGGAPTQGGKGGKKAKGYASGGFISGPGTGTSDSIVAMVSTGEAIIPADKAKKYAPLVRGIISGNIPGFAIGTEGAAKKSAGLQMNLPGGAELGHFSEATTMLGKELIAAVREAVEARRATQAELQKVITAVGDDVDKVFKVFDSRVERVSRELNQGIGDVGSTVTVDGVQVEKSVPKELVARDLVERGRDARSPIIAQMIKNKVSPEDALRKADMITAEVERRMAELGDKVAYTAKDINELTQGAYDAVANADDDVKKAYEDMQRFETYNNSNDQGRKEKGGVRESFGNGYKKAKARIRGVGAKLFPSAYGKAAFQTTADMAEQFGGTERDVQQTFKNLPDEAKLRVHAKLAEGTEAFIKELILEAEKAVEEGYNKATARRSPPKEIVKAGQDSGEAFIAGARENIDDAAVVGEQIGAATTQGARTGAGATGAGGTTIIPGSNLDREENNEKKKGITTSKKLLGNLSKAGMALSAVSAGLSMIPGELGQTAQQMLMPLMSLSAVLPMLATKAGLATVAIGAFVAAIVWNNMAMDAARKKGFELAESLGAGEKNIRSLAEFAGRVSAGEAQDQLRKDKFSQWEIKAGKKTFGESFVESDPGKAMLQSVKNVISQGGGRTGAQTQLLSQLSSAVASGALSAAEARSIAANIGEQLGDFTFGIQVNARMTELLGPNGENLEKDPLKVRVALIQDTKKTLQSRFAANKQQSIVTPTDAGLATGGTLVGAAGGTVAGSIIGGWAAGGIAGTLATMGASAATAAAVGSVVPVVGTIVGLIAGAIGGAIVGSIQRNERLAKAAGATVAMSQMALQQQQEMLDSLDLDYQKRIDAARAAGDLARVEELTTQHVKDRSVLMEEQAGLVRMIAEGYKQADSGLGIDLWGMGGMRAQLNAAADEAIKNKYKDDPIGQVLATQAGSLIKDANLSDEMDFTLRVALSTGDIDPALATQFFSMFGQNKDMMDASVNLIANMGTKFFGESMQAMNMFVTADGQPIQEHQTAFMMKLSTMGTTDAQNLVNLMADAGKAGGKVPLDIIATIYSTNPAAQAELQAVVKDLDALNGKNIEVSVAQKIMGSEDFAVLKADQEYFDKLPPIQRRIYIQTMETLLNLEGDPNMIQLFDNWVSEGGGTRDNATFQDFVTFLTHQKTETADATQYGGGTPTPTGGGGPTSSPIDDYLKKLRDLRNELVKVPVGFAASMKEINKWFGGNKTIKVYDGLKNQMRGLGLDEGLIETLIGMDPEEFEKQKKKLFKVDAKGMIKGLTDAGKELREVSDSVTMGTWNDKMEVQTKLTQDQQKAFSRLTKAGMSVADAYETIQDAALAQALASKNVTDADIKARVEQNNIMQDNLRLMEAMTALEKKNSAVKDTTRLLKGVDKAKDFGFSQEDMQKILADDTMREAYQAMIQPNVKPEDAKRLQKVIADALKMANLTAANDLVLKYKSGISGLGDIFTEGMDKAMETFNVKEKSLQIKADIQMKPFNDAIEAAQDQIAALQYQIDDYDAGLTRIADQEELINKAYDDKLEALDKVQKANDTIARQQKNQLGLADALASGDIAAAARAAQEIRQQDAQDALDRQRDTLEKARKSELERTTVSVTVNGQQTTMTRKQIEDAKKGLEDQVFNIEEASLEPAQEAIRQIQAKLREDIQSITVQGKTKLQWEELGNKVDMARVNSEKFADAIANATTVVDELVAAWGKEKGMTIAEAQAIVNNTNLSEVAGEYVAPVADTQVNNTSGRTSSSSSSSSGGGQTGQETKETTETVVPTASGVDTTATPISADLADRQTMISTSDAGVVSYAKTLGTKFKKAFEGIRDYKDSAGKVIGFARGAGSAYAGMNFTDKAAYDAKYAEYESLGKEAMNLGLATQKTVGKVKYYNPNYNLLSNPSTITLQDLFRDNDNSDGFTSSADMRAAFTETQLSKIKSGTLKDAIEWIQGRSSTYKKDKQAIATADDVLRAAYASPNGLNGLSFDNPANTPAKLKEAYDKLTATQKAGVEGKNHPYMKLVTYLSNNRTSIAKEEAKTQKAINTMADHLALTNSYRDAIRNSRVNVSGVLSEADMKNVYASYSNPGYKLIPSSITKYATGGMVMPAKFANGGFASGTDTVPAMLTPGEFVVRKFAVDSFGADRLEAINAGIDPSAGGNSNTSIIGGDSLYNYNVSVNVRSDADPNAIARTVMEQIRRVDSQRIRSTRV